MTTNSLTLILLLTCPELLLEVSWLWAGIYKRAQFLSSPIFLLKSRFFFKKILSKSNETRWDTDTICAWLDTLGLYMYSNEVRKSVTSGAQLAALTSQELESKLGIRNLMHRKKVCLALLARQQGTEDPAGLLDHQVQIVAFSFITIPCSGCT